MRVWPILVAVAMLAGCGGSEQAATTTVTTNTTPTASTTGAETTVSAFFYRNGALEAVPVEVPETVAVARAALEQLLAGPPGGFETALPDGVQLEDVTIADGIARATFSSELGEPPRTAQAQIVRTLTQFPTVHAATIEVDGKGAAALENGAGDVLERPATSDDFADLTAEAPIFVESPARDSIVSSPVRAAGTANVFEATFQVEVWSGDRKLRTQTITASAGTGTRGTWSATIDVPPGPARLVFYEPSAEDGRPLHATVVYLKVR